KSCWKNLYHGLKQENQPVTNPLPANCSFKNMIDEVREKKQKLEQETYLGIDFSGSALV
ncbi:unnamed protein product, partial [Arabidopsis halleri]